VPRVDTGAGEEAEAACGAGRGEVDGVGIMAARGTGEAGAVGAYVVSKGAGPEAACGVGMDSEAAVEGAGAVPWLRGRRRSRRSCRESLRSNGWNPSLELK
jgi:hypothetical protein